MHPRRIQGSFRDPAGEVFLDNGVVHRRIHDCGRDDYDQFIRSGLYQELVSDRLLIPHNDVGRLAEGSSGVYTVIRPEQLDAVSYPFEWAFSQLKDAALLTLTVQRRALARGLSLKDASAFNVQFHRGRPIFIDTLSFEPVPAGPWLAYRQFCQQFYAPLALMAFTDVRLGRLSNLFLDGVPLDLASRLLPARTRLQRGPLMHVHLHAWAERRLAQGNGPRVKSRLGVAPTLALIDSLESAIGRLRWNPVSDWTRYASSDGTPEPPGSTLKRETVKTWLDHARPGVVWDCGANTGRISRVSSALGIPTVAFDRDPACVEIMYRQVKASGDTRLLPLVMDLASPSAGVGWANTERASLLDRGPADMVLALALVHHLALTDNVPLDRIADFFHAIARQLIVEFVPATDPLAATLARARPGAVSGYTIEAFEDQFQRHFTIARRLALPNSSRVLYWMHSR